MFNAKIIAGNPFKTANGLTLNFNPAEQPDIFNIMDVSANQILGKLEYFHFQDALILKTIMLDNHEQDICRKGIGLAVVRQLLKEASDQGRKKLTIKRTSNYGLLMMLKKKFLERVSFFCYSDDEFMHRDGLFSKDLIGPDLVYLTGGFRVIVHQPKDINECFKVRYGSNNFYNKTNKAIRAYLGERANIAIEFMHKGSWREMKGAQIYLPTMGFNVDIFVP